MSTSPIQLGQLQVTDVLALDAALRRMGEGAQSMEAVAQRAVRHLFDRLRHGDKPACALVRFYKTHRYGELPVGVRQHVRGRLGREPAPEAVCLTLLATVGERPEWNSRTTSQDHQAIPLESADSLRRTPMVLELVRQLGIAPEVAVQLGSSSIVDLQKRSYNVFHVPEALGSPAVPAQEGFVKPYGIRSVLGFGAVLPSGDLACAILFSRVAISAEAAGQCKLLALSIRRPLLDLRADQTFSND